MLSFLIRRILQTIPTVLAVVLADLRAVQRRSRQHRIEHER